MEQSYGKKMIKLSIIIPHYNAGKLLKRLLYSIPNSDEIEVLVIDDKSTDGIKEYQECMENFKNRNVIFYSNTTKKKGAGVARNIGLMHARGKWLTFMDADDYACSDLNLLIQKYENVKEDIIFFPPTSICIETQKESERHVHYMHLVNDYIENPTKENELKLRYNFYSPCSKFIRKEIVDRNQIKFSETLFSNDVMFSTITGYSAKAVMAGKETFYCITENDFGLTKEVNPKSIKIRREILYKRMKFLLQRVSPCDWHILELDADSILNMYCEHMRISFIYSFLKDMVNKFRK